MQGSSGCLLYLLSSCVVDLQLFKAPHFTIGSTGSMRSSRCHAEISADGRFVAAGAADGQVGLSS
jgi:hypothetical protein